MSTKIDYMAIAPEVVRPLFDANKLLAKSSLEPALLNFIDLRASQLNGCGFCLALHMREGQALGENLDRLSGVAAWRDAPWYSERERVALEWTEALTHLSSAQVPGDLLNRLKAHFTEMEIVYLTLAVNTINSYNRFNVAFGTSSGRADTVFKMLHPEVVETPA